MKLNIRWILLLMFALNMFSLFAGNVKSIDEKSFAAEISNGYVLVDFWAPWCGPCKRLGPVLDKLSDEYTNIKFVKVNTDENRSLSSKFQIRSIPYVVLFKDGKKVDSFTGALPEESIRKFLTANAGNASSDKMNFKTAYDFTLNDLEGNSVTLSEIKGVVILDFWATWCPPCKKEIPFLLSLQKKYQNITIIGISNEDVETQKKFVETMKSQGVNMNYTLLVDSQTSSSVSAMYRINSIPSTYIIGKDGTLVKKEVGFADELAAEIDKAVSEALSK